MNKLKESICSINYKLFFLLLLLGIGPTIYNTVRLYYIGGIGESWSFTIAAQMSWVDLMYETIHNIFILPLFFLVSRNFYDKEELKKRVRSGFFFNLLIYIIFTVIIIICTPYLVDLMAIKEELKVEAIEHIRLESIGNIFLMASGFGTVVLFKLHDDKFSYITAIVRLVLTILFDTIFFSSFPFSLKLGLKGIGFSNIIINVILLIINISFIYKNGIKLFGFYKLEFGWLKGIFTTGEGFGIEGIVRNTVYIFMVHRLLNIIDQEGMYMVANFFIFGWLLFPITRIGELIKQEALTDNKEIQNKSFGFLIIVTFFVICWFIGIPLWKTIFRYLFNYNDIDSLFKFVLILSPFFVSYAYQIIFDATFAVFGKKKQFMMTGVVTVGIYYVIAFVLYIFKVFNPTLLNIALVYGIGVLIESFISLIIYIKLLKDKKINILK